MFLQLTKKDGNKLLVNSLAVLLEETDLGLVVHFNGEKWLVTENLSDVKYSIAQAFASSNSAHMQQNNGGKLVT